MPRITDRLREAWQVLQRDQGLDTQAAAASFEQAQQSMVHGEAATVAIGNTNISAPGMSRLEEIARSGDLYQLDAALYAEVKRQIAPEIKKYADEVYRGRIDRLVGANEDDLSEHLDPNASLPWRLVDQSIREIAGEAYSERALAADRILRQAVGERHSEFYLKAGSDTRDDDVRTYQHRGTRNLIYLDPEGQFQNIDRTGASTPTTKEEVLARYRETPTATLTEDPGHRRAWEPMEKALGYEAANRFTAYGNQDGIQMYGTTDEYDNRTMIGIDEKGRFYDMHGDPTRISRHVALARTGQPENFYTLPEFAPGERALQKLEETVGVTNARDFTWKQESQGIHTYQHDETKNHIHVDGDGRLYNQNREPITRESALQSALPGEASREPAIAAPAVTLEHSLAIEQALPRRSGAVANRLATDGA